APRLRSFAISTITWPPLKRLDRICADAAHAAIYPFSVAALVFVLGQQSLIQGMPLRRDLAVFECREYAAARFMPMAAVVEAAMCRGFGEFRKAAQDVFGAQVVQPESLESR